MALALGPGRCGCSGRDRAGGGRPLLQRPLPTPHAHPLPWTQPRSRPRAVPCAAAAGAGGSSKSLFVLGLGYTSLGLVRRAEAAGTEWCATVRTPACRCLQRPPLSPLLTQSIRPDHLPPQQGQHHIHEPPARAAGRAGAAAAALRPHGRRPARVRPQISVRATLHATRHTARSAANSHPAQQG